MRPPTDSWRSHLGNTSGARVGERASQPARLETHPVERQLSAMSTLHRIESRGDGQVVAVPVRDHHPDPWPIVATMAAVVVAAAVAALVALAVGPDREPVELGELAPAALTIDAEPEAVSVV